MRHSQLVMGDSRALSSTTVRNLLTNADEDWNRLPWLTDEVEMDASRGGQMLPWLIAVLAVVSSFSYVQGRLAVESSVVPGSCLSRTGVAASCVRVWQSVPLGSVRQTRATASHRDGRLPPTTAMNAGDRELLGEWLLLARTLSPGESDALPRPIAPD